MALLECPTRVDLPCYHYNITLEGTTYTLSFKWNSRMAKWFVTLGDAAGADILSNIPLVANWPLLARFKMAGKPPGQLVAFDTSLKNLDAGRFDLGNRVRLMYQESTT